MSNIISHDLKIKQMQHYNFLELYVLKKGHPIGLIFEIIGVLWTSYYLWFQVWPWALIVFLLIKIISFLAVVDVNPFEMSETTLGKISLLHLHPTNFALQLCGIILSYGGVWIHSVEIIMGGLTLILLGHLVGWSRVNSKFSTESNTITK